MSELLKQQSVPIQPFLVTNNCDDQFWAISQSNNSNLEIWNYSVTDDRFKKYFHQIESKEKGLTASYDKHNSILYIINAREIIIMDIKTHKHKTVPNTVFNESCDCIVDDQGKLHIVGNVSSASVPLVLSLRTCFCVLNKEQTLIKVIHVFDCRILQPRIVHHEFHAKSRSCYMRLIDGIHSYYYQHWYTDENMRCISGRHDLTGWRTLYKYQSIRYNKDKMKYTLYFKGDRIVLQYCPYKNNNKAIVTVFSDITMPFVPITNNAILLKQSSRQNNILLIGYIKMFNKSTIIPIDVINLINGFYSWYNLHLFDQNGNHYAIKIDEIINKSQKYTGIIGSYNIIEGGRSRLTIQIRGKIDEFYNHGFPVIKVGGNHNNPTKVQESVINALNKIFTSFAQNENGTISMDDMRRYILHCGAGQNAASKSRLKLIFNSYGNSETKLNLKGFIDFYAAAIIDRPNFVMEDFQTFGYTEDELFRPTGECIDGLCEEFMYINEVVDFDVKVKHDGTKYAVNVTKPNAALTDKLI